MTEQEIINMRPGLDMDLALAEKLMKWVVDREESQRCGVAVVRWEEDGKEVWRWFSPSQKKDDAWEVLEKFPYSKMERVEFFEGRVTVNVTVWPDIDEQTSYTGLANTFPHAVCLAALLALRGGE
ncbi:BC1872 family protein [Paenibacillus oleatilyticus]|uniref:Phage ABA sandwich domain-containing protein n=1 Tax=Paenibacillus oleatilyticus TaxID=2594886 RepID=A0ABV4UVH1_9BACL